MRAGMRGRDAGKGCGVRPAGAAAARPHGPGQARKGRPWPGLVKDVSKLKNMQSSEEGLCRVLFWGNGSGERGEGTRKKHRMCTGYTRPSASLAGV